MIRNEQGFVGHIDELEPVVTGRESGLQDLDLRVVPGTLTGCDGVCLFRSVFKPNGSNTRHIHPNADEFLYVIRGRAALGAGDEEHLGVPGTVHIIPASVTHWLRNLDADHSVEVIGGYLGVASREEAGYLRVGDVSEEYWTIH